MIKVDQTYLSFFKLFLLSNSNAEVNANTKAEARIKRQRYRRLTVSSRAKSDEPVPQKQQSSLRALDLLHSPMTGHGSDSSSLQLFLFQIHSRTNTTETHHSIVPFTNFQILLAFSERLISLHSFSSSCLIDPLLFSFVDVPIAPNYFLIV